MSEAPEEWYPIPDYEGYYEASKQGCVRSMGRRTWTGAIWSEPFILKPRMRPGDKYLTIDLYRDGKRKPTKLHYIIAEVFHGPRPPGMEVCHRNDQKLDNRAENLYYGTHAQNAQEMVRNGLHAQAAKTYCKNGHEFTLENTYLRPTGGRGCRKCRLAAVQRYEAKQRAAKRAA